MKRIIPIILIASTNSGLGYIYATQALSQYRQAQINQQSQYATSQIKDQLDRNQAAFEKQQALQEEQRQRINDDDNEDDY
jgi:hypothetical protein